jgi:hypothetical protein
MNKILLVGVVGALVVGGVALAKNASVAATPEGQACQDMQRLCSTEEPSQKDLNECVDGMKKLRKLSGDASFERSRACLAESSSCAAAAGCMGGGVGMGAMGEMMKGFGSALSR